MEDGKDTCKFSFLSRRSDFLGEWTDEKHVSLSLPSLRIDNFSDELREKLALVRRSGLTFAAEAGTQRLRDVINKNVTEEDLLRSVGIAFRGSGKIKQGLLIDLFGVDCRDLEVTLGQRACLVGESAATGLR
mgnify:CR=1 FL=1